MLPTVLIALLVAAAACLYLGRRLTTAQAETAAARRLAEALQARLGAATMGSFDLSDKDSGASPGLAAALGIEPEGPLDLPTLLAAFDDSGRRELEAALESLEQEGRDFGLRLQTKANDAAVIAVMGARLEGVGADGGAGDFLWFQDQSELVNRLEGKITVDSSRGQGTTVRVEIGKTEPA